MMPPVMKQPKVYTGFVISMIGGNAGKRVPMDFSVAQAMCANGTARWEDDTSDMPRQLKGEIDRRDAAEQAARERDAGIVPESVEAILWENAKPIYMVEEDGVVYIARPLPGAATIKVAGDISDVYSVEDENVMVSAANATALYKIVDRSDDGEILLSLSEVDHFDNDIPEGWRERRAIANIAQAKAIRRVKKGINGEAAVAIIEEWIKTDDSVSEEAGPETEHGRIKDGNHDATEGAGDPAKRAEEKAQEFLNEDE